MRSIAFHCGRIGNPSYGVWEQRLRRAGYTGGAEGAAGELRNSLCRGRRRGQRRKGAVRPFVAATWRAKLDELVERRAGAFEQMLPIKTAADARRYTSNFLTVEHKKITKLQRDALRAVLPASLAKDEMLEALDLTMSFEAWRRLRYEQGLSVRQAQAVLRRMLAALLD